MEKKDFKIGQLIEANFFGTCKASGNFIKWIDENVIEVEVVSDDAGIEEAGNIAQWHKSHIINSTE